MTNAADDLRPAAPGPATGPRSAAEAELTRLLAIMAALRAPATGCPWDIEQDFRSIAPYTIEEAYEVADAIERGDMADLEDELGDLLLQVVFHARMAEEAGLFDFAGVARAITAKMLRRHPHVFGDEIARGAGMAKGAWDRIKAQEKAARAARAGAGAHAGDIPAASALSGVTAALPALTRAVKLQERAGKVGFDWNDPFAVIAKMREELDETEAALRTEGIDRQREEVGDLLFATANLARHLAVDPEGALRAANAKFVRRFLFIEAGLAAQGLAPADASLDEMEALWTEAKRAEKAGV